MMFIFAKPTCLDFEAEAGLSVLPLYIYVCMLASVINPSIQFEIVTIDIFRAL